MIRMHSIALRRGIRSRVRSRGTAVAYFLVVMSVLWTGVIMTMALASGTQAQVANLTLKRDQAFYAAEAGLQLAFWKLQNNNNWRAGAAAPLFGTVGNATYSVTAVGDWNAPVLVTAVGRVGTQAASRITATCTPAVTVPAISLGNNFDNSGNVTINGDVQAMGNITTSGQLTDNGSLTAGGSITTSGSVSVSGGTVQNAPGITVPVIDFNSLKSSANQSYHVPPGNPLQVDTLNFGNGGIIYFDGPIYFKGSTTITGYGTLVVNGDVSIRSAASFGSSASPAQVNIVSTGALDVSGYLGLVGSVYVSGDITKNGGLDITGVVVGQADMSTSGGLNITRAQPPSFDPRSAPSGIGSMNLARITGPIF